MDDITTVLDRPWIRHIASSKYMVSLLRLLRTGRKKESIYAKFPLIPKEYIDGALEALVKLGILKEIDVSGEKFYVLSPEGKVVVTYVESFRDYTDEE